MTRQKVLHRIAAIKDRMAGATTRDERTSLNRELDAILARHNLSGVIIGDDGKPVGADLGDKRSEE